MYGSETWTDTEHMKSLLETWEHKIFRKIYGRIKDKNAWRTKNNDELQVMYRKPNIVTTINVRKLEWAGRLVRMADDRTVKKVFLWEPAEEEKKKDQNSGG